MENKIYAIRIFVNGTRYVFRIYVFGSKKGRLRDLEYSNDNRIRVNAKTPEASA